MEKINNTTENNNEIESLSAEMKDAKEGMVRDLADGHINSAFEIREKFNVPEEVVNSQEVQQAAKKGMVKELTRGRIDSALKIKEKFNVPEEVVNSQEVQQAAKEGMVRNLADGHINSALVIKKKFNVPEEVVNSQEVQQVAEEMMVIELADEYSINSALVIKEKFNVPEEVAQQAAKEGMVRELADGKTYCALEIKEKFNVSEEIAQQAAGKGMIRLLEDGKIDDALEIKEKFNVSKKIINSQEVQQVAEEMMIRELVSENTDSALEIKEKFNIKDKFFDLSYEIFGSFLTFRTYDMIGDMLDGKEILEEMKEIGVTEKGTKGVGQMKEAVKSFKKEALLEDFDLEQLLSGEIKRDIFKSAIRYKTSQWGKKDDASFQETIETRIDLSKEIRPLKEEYQPKDGIRINKLNRKESIDYTNDFLNKYSSLRSSLSEALDLSKKEKKPFSSIVGRMEETKQSLIEELEEKLQEAIDRKENEKGIENRNKQIEILKSCDLRSIKNIQDNFVNLTKYKVFENDLRQIVYLYAIIENDNAKRKVEELIEKEIPEMDDLTKMVDLNTHLINEETWKKMFDNNKALKAIDKLTDVSSVSEEITRFQNLSISGTSSFSFIPTRGILMEFSGQIADACWASEYKSIAKSFPNLSTVVFIQNRGTKNERLVGSCMLIETETENGDKALVIRGLNPIENVINTLSIKDFYDKFTEYTKEISSKLNAKLAITIDDHSGGSGTNRPALHNFLWKNKDNLEKVQLKENSQTQNKSTFNGYDITGNCWMV